MKKTVRLPFRSVLATAAFLSLSSVSFAQTVATGGSYTSTLGEAFISMNSGFWAKTAVTDVTTAINAVYNTESGVSLSNSAADKTVSVKVSQEMIDGGAYYCVYSTNGMLLDRQQITESPVTVDYSKYTSHVILTINTKKGAVATFKLAK